jgi:hypothetical protein
MFVDPLPRRLAPAWRKFARMGLPLTFKFGVSFYLWTKICVSAGKVFQEGRSMFVFVSFDDPLL